MSTSILESAPTSNYFLRSHFVRSIGRPLDRSAARSFVRSFVRWMRLVRSRKYTSNGPYGHTVRRFSGEACRVHPRHRWVAGPLVLWWGVLLVDRRDPLGRREGDPREGLRCSTLSSIFSFSSFARTSYPLEEPPDL